EGGGRAENAGPADELANDSTRDDPQDDPSLDSGDSTDDHDSALPPESDDAAEDDFPPDDSPDSEVEEASDDEIHDLALAVETSGYPGHGHEVTSRPSEDDQG